MLYIKDSIKKKKNTKTIVKFSNPCLVLLNKTTKIMVNQCHALIFNKKKGETIIGVLVKDFIFIFIFIITWLRLR